MLDVQVSHGVNKERCKAWPSLAAALEECNNISFRPSKHGVLNLNVIGEAIISQVVNALEGWHGYVTKNPEGHNSALCDRISRCSPSVRGHGRERDLSHAGISARAHSPRSRHLPVAVGLR